tara:strand:- start:445 stop:627 length:183 start_codon:yes stop_codon:yes gene_type:complete
MVKKINQFLGDVRSEMDKVSWPTWDELRSSTYVVLTLSLMLIVFLFVIDFVLAKILNIVL